MWGCLWRVSWRCRAKTSRWICILSRSSRRTEEYGSLMDVNWLDLCIMDWVWIKVCCVIVCLWLKSLWMLWMDWFILTLSRSRRISVSESTRFIECVLYIEFLNCIIMLLLFVLFVLWLLWIDCVRNYLDCDASSFSTSARRRFVFVFSRV